MFSRSTGRVFNKPHRDKFYGACCGRLPRKTLLADLLHFMWTYCIDGEIDDEPLSPRGRWWTIMFNFTQENYSYIKIHTSCHRVQTENITPVLYTAHITADALSKHLSIFPSFVNKTLRCLNSFSWWPQLAPNPEKAINCPAAENHGHRHGGADSNMMGQASVPDDLG